MTAYTKIPEDILRSVLDIYSCKGVRPYHNADHILNMYAFLEEAEAPYFKELDWAILFHDVIYDAIGNNEQRSAEFFMNTMANEGLLSDEEMANVYDLIMVTKDHVAPTGDRLAHWIVLADLSSFINLADWWESNRLVEKELMDLYPMDRQDFLEKNTAFIKDLRKRLMPIVPRDVDVLTTEQILLYYSITDNITRIVNFQSVIINSFKERGNEHELA